MGCGASSQVAGSDRGVVLVGTTPAHVSVTRSMMGYMPSAVSVFYTKRFREPDMPLLEAYPAAVLFADISGFSFLLEQLSQHRDTAGGPERLTYLMNGFLGDLVDAIIYHGGDIIQFAGDAFLAVWRAPKASVLGEITLKVIKCGTDVQKLIANSQVSDGANAVSLSMRIEIGAGEVTGLHFGTSERRSYVVVGQEVDNAYRADKLNTPGNIVLTKAAYDCLKAHSVVAEKIPDQDYYKLLNIKAEVRSDMALLPSSLPDENLISPYLPGHVLELVRAKQIDWLAEVRNVTMVFALLPKSEYPPSAKQYGTFMQDNLSDIIEATARYDGMLAHLSSDDKGIFAVIVLGVPSHENDALRGVSTAVEIVRRFTTRKARAQIGVATGVSVSCSVGSKNRCQYTLYGGTVNLAARLMVSALKCNVPILCDEATANEAKSRFFFKPLDALELKGFGQVVPYTPEIQTNWTQKTNPTAATASGKSAKINIVGRRDEIKQFLTAGQTMMETRKSACFLIEAEIGQGRGTLISKLTAHAQESGFRVLYGEADSIDIAPFNAFKNILIGLFRITATETNESRREKVANKIPVQYLPYLALLNIVLPMSFPDSEKSFLLKGASRVDMLKKMIIAMLQQSVLHRPTLLILQDVQWLDSASWGAVHTIVHSVHPILVVLGSRTIPNPIPAVYQKLTSLGVKELHLGPLSDAENKLVIKEKLEIKAEPPDNLMAFVKEVTGGNLLFMHELLVRMKQTPGVLVEESGKLEFTGFKDDGSNSSKLSRNMRLLLTSKIDSLEPDAQLLVRVASIIGRVFKWDAAVNIYPNAARRPQLEEDLIALEEADLIGTSEDRESALQSKISFQFKSALIQQIVYSSMVSKMREQLHARAAEWYVSEYGNRADVGLYYPTIVYHYENASLPSEALQFSLKAAEYSMSVSATAEAATFFAKAIASPVFHELPLEKQVKVQVVRVDTLFASGKVAEATKLAITAITQLGYPDPEEIQGRSTLKGLINTFFTARATTAVSIAQDNIAEREKMLEMVLLYIRTLNCFGSSQVRNLTKLYVHILTEVVKILLSIGNLETFSGILSAISFALAMSDLPEESDNYFNRALKAMKNTTELSGPLQHIANQIRTRTTVFDFLLCIGRGLFTDVDAKWGSLKPQLLAANDVRSLVTVSSNYTSSLILQGRFADAQAVCAEYTKISIDLDSVQFSLMLPVFECYALIRIGNAQEAHLKLLNVESAIRDNASVEQRVTICAAAIRGLCYLQKKEYQNAMESILPIEATMFDLETSSPSFMIALLAFMEVISELAMDPRFKDHKQALTIWEKMAPKLERHGRVFPVTRGNILLRDAQLTRMNSEITGEDNHDVSRDFAASLEDALVEIQNLDVNFDKGVLHSTLAQNYDKNDIKAFEHYSKACLLFQKTGAVKHYIELKQFWEGVVQFKQHSSLGSMSTSGSTTFNQNSGRYRNP